LLQTFDGEVTDEILAELWELRLLGVEDLGVPAATSMADSGDGA